MSADLISVFEPVRGWAAAMGLRFAHVSAERVEAEWTVGPEHLQPFGLVHGGVFSGVVETVCSVGAVLHVPPGKTAVGMENQTSFLRPVTAGTLRAVGKPVHQGRNTELWEAQIIDEQMRLVATGRVRLMVVDLPASNTGSRAPDAAPEQRGTGAPQNKTT